MLISIHYSDIKCYLITDQISIISSGGGYGNDANSIFQNIKRDNVKRKRFRLKCWRFTDEKTAAIQAADILVWMNNKTMLNRIVGSNNQESSKCAEKLVGDRSEYCVYFGENNLKKEVMKFYGITT
jgi:hypothetical protein